MSDILKIDNVHKDFFTEKGQKIEALKDIKLSIKKNEFISLLGSSGCGKSTLLRIIAGLEKSTLGEIYYRDKLLDNHHSEIGMVFQNYSLLPWRTVLDNVTLSLEFAGKNRKERYNTGMDFLKLVGLDNFANSYPYELSGGMQQRVAIVRSLANEPELLLMDEPFGALDAHTRMLLQEEMLGIWEKTKKTILFVTHSVDEAIYMSDIIVVMTRSPGRIKEIVQVDMPRPRDRAHPNYGLLLTKLLDSLGEEVSKSIKENEVKRAEGAF